MSKKRKTRKQKEKAIARHDDHAGYVQIDTPTYSIPTVIEDKRVKAKKVATKPNVNLDEVKMLKKDMISIAAASGIILAFDILLLVMLSTGVLKLNFLGY